MDRMKIIALIAGLTIFSGLVSAQAGDVAELNSVTVSPDSGDYVMGERVTTTFEYTLNEITRTKAIETILVLDESGSMGGTKMDNVKTAAKNYVDQINVNAGDKVGVVAFEDNARTVQGLSSDKGSVKNSVDGLSADGGTNLGGGINEADFYTSGDDAVEAMVVLSDGNHNSGTGPDVPAQDARDNGISVHGIMYGSGASTSDMEEVTGSNCEMDSGENSDGDNCWYATTSSISDVYDSINNEIKKSASGVKVHAVLENAEVPSDQYISKSGNEYVIGAPSTTGTHTESISWYLAEKGDDVTVKTGDSFLEYRVSGSQKTKDFSAYTETKDGVEYMDLDVSGGSSSKNGNAATVSVDVKNTGNHEVPGGEVSFYVDDPGDGVKESFGTLPSGDTTTVTASSVDPSNMEVSTSTDDIRAKADWSDEIIEPSESDNTKDIGRIDVGAPQTTDDYSKSGWQNTTQTVELDCSDSHPGKTRGCNQVDWRIEKDGSTVRNGNSIGSSTTVDVGSSEEGVLDLYYRSWDNAGNSESWDSTQIKVDTTDPETTDNTDDQWHKTPQTVQLSANDAASGVQQVFYCRDDEPGCETDNLYSGSFEVSENGTTYVRYRAVDVAGNWEDVESTEVKVDMKKPTTTDDYPGGWHNTSINVNLICNDRPDDDNSGCDFTEYCSDISDTCVPDEDGTSVLFDTEGRHHLRYKSTDVAGNEGELNSTLVKLDFSAPSVTVEKEILDNGGINATAVCEDSLSGCDNPERQLYTSTSPFFRCPEDPSEYETKPSITVEKEMWICAIGKDNAGHWETSGESVQFDASTLTVSMTHPGSSEAVYASKGSKIPITLTIGNTKQKEREVNIRLNGINAYFSRTGDETEEFELGAGNAEIMQIMVSPKNTGGGSLDVEVTDETENIEIERQLLFQVVDSRKRIGDRKTVPGIGPLQILMLIGLASVYFFFRPRTSQ